jgi:hypothetical protein
LSSTNITNVKDERLELVEISKEFIENFRGFWFYNRKNIR